MTAAERARIADRLHSAAIHLLRHARADDPLSGLTPARASALSVLVFGGERTIGELAAAEQVTPPTMTRLVAALERDGWVRRRGDPADGRIVRVAPTARARRALDAARRRRVARVAALLEELPASGWRSLDGVLGHLEAALEEGRG